MQGPSEQNSIRERRVAAIERALDLLLVQMAEAQRNRPPTEQWVIDLNKQEHLEPTGRNWMTLDEVMDGEHLSPAEEVAFDLYGETPVYAALLDAVRNLGESLHAYTRSTGTMQKVFDRVCQMRPKNDFRATVLNSAWERIGGWCD